MSSTGAVNDATAPYAESAGFRLQPDGARTLRSDSAGILRKIIRSYDSPIVRAYCWGRFQILHLRFLDEVAQYLPREGMIIDVGCGFGLFSLYFAATHPDRQIRGFDLNPRRVEMARRSAERLGLSNVSFHAEDAQDWAGQSQFDAAYMLDIVHHIPRSAVEGLVSKLRDGLNPAGVLVIKDVADRPLYKAAFTWALDKAMDFRTPVHYWSMDELADLLRSKSLQVFAHQMVDVLPYPHVIYICRPA